MILMSKWKRLFRQTNTFQRILCIILFHSLASIFIIYIHLSWFFNEEEKLWKTNEGNTYSKNEAIIWNINSVRNVLSTNIISNDDISIVGWWMDHAKWDIDIKCFNQRWSLCSKGFSSTCKSDGIRAIYQYINFPKHMEINALDLSVTATADQLESQVVGSSFGALALIKLHTGKQETVEIQFPSNIEPLTTKSITYSAFKSHVSSVTLMLMCYGFTGSVHFTEPQLVPRGNSYQITRTFLKHCPLKSQSQKSTQFINRIEEIMKANISLKESDLVTLVTQVSMDRLATLERSLHSWEGPVSLVIYVTIKQAEKSEYEWRRLYIMKKLKNINISPTSHITLAYGKMMNSDYPINTLRNIAIRNVKTKYMFLLDADFQPSVDFQHKFSAVTKHNNFNLKTGFIIPAFEYIELPQRNDNAPQTKEELLQLLHREEPYILPFRISESSESHKTTDYWKWYRSERPYYIELYSDKYEPYIVLQKTDDVAYYDDRFTGYGMNKVTYITELYAANYTFIVLPDVWVLHLPHKVSPFAVEFLQNPHQRLENRMKRFEFLSDIMNLYKIGSCQIY